MLYPKTERPFDENEFKSPGSEYRGTPFWAWNCKLSEEMLLEQVNLFHEMGFGGFHMHVRTGMDTAYLSGRHMELMRLCNERAKELGMLTWLYDEDRWPSGAAGGFVTKDWRYRERFLRLSPYYKPAFEADRGAFDNAIAKNQKPLGYLLACYKITLKDGGLTAYKRLAAANHGERDGLWYAYLELSGESPWYNNQAYVNTLDKQAIDRFIEVTHDRYFEELGSEFSRSIPAIFTDEPQFKTKQTFDFAEERKETFLPFTDDLPETFLANYGYDLMDRLPEIFWDLPGRFSQVRYHYHDHVCDRFTEAFPKNIGDWCGAHKLALTGHVNAEQNLTSQTYSLGEAMRCYPHFQLPGIDMLCDGHEYSTAKQAQSIVHQCGREGMLSELYGVTNWDFDFKGHKLHGDWQAALGVTIRVPHLAWMSMRGEAKRDYPASIFYQSPWYKEYPLIENHFARLNTALTRGQCRARIGVVHPIESFWLLWGPKQQTYDRRNAAEKDFADITEWLLFGLLDFDFVDESLLPGQAHGGNPLAVGKMKYDVIVVPPCITLRKTTLEILRRFRQAGGDVVFFGSPPTLVDALPSGEAAAFAALCRQYPFGKMHLLDALAPYREVEALDGQGVRAGNLLYQLREDGAEKWLFVCHVYRKQNHFEQAEPFKFILDGCYKPTLYDTMTGQVSPISYRHRDGKTIIDRMMYAEESLLLRLASSTEQPQSPAADARHYTGSTELPEPESYTLEEPNVLLLDMAEYSLDGEPYQSKEELLRLDNLVRARLGYPNIMEHVSQPWVIQEETAAAHSLRLRFTIESEIDYNAPCLALEIQDGQRVCWNGIAVDVIPVRWFTDKSIQTIALPPLRKGKNELVLESAFCQKSATEWCYLLGNFGVRVCGANTCITKKPEQVCYGNLIPQGMPFYGGNITYQTSIQGDGKTGKELFVPRFVGPVISVRVDGKDAGHIAFAPHTLDLGVLDAGTHSVDITLFGSRVNSFGCVHNTNTELTWYGPDCWRTQGNDWAYQYQLKPFGIMQNPQVKNYLR